MAISPELLEKLKVGGKYLGSTALGGGIGTLLGAVEGVKYNHGYTAATNFKPVKSKKERKKNLKHYAIGGGVGGALAGAILYGKIRAIDKEFNKHRNYYSGNYGNRGGRAGSSYSKSSFDTHKKTFEGFGINVDKIKTKAEFKKAYRDLAKQYHPDVSNAPDAADNFKKINNAAEALRNSAWHEKLAFLMRTLGMEKIAKAGDEVMEKLAEYKKAIEKMASQRKDNPHAIIPRNRYKEYDTFGQSIARTGKHLGAGALAGGGIGAGIGALKGGKSGAAGGLAMGSLLGILGGSVTDTVAQSHSDKRAAIKRYEGNPKAIRRAMLLGPAYADNYVRKQKHKQKKADYVEGIEKLAFSGFNKKRAKRKILEMAVPQRG
jgi:hypothetical protein